MLNIDDILSATGGRLVQGNLKTKVSGVSIDSRSVKKNELFIAIKGKSFDGHQFLGKAVAKGVRALVVSKNIRVKDQAVAVIRVQNTTQAFGDLARFHRNRFSLPVVAITASAGKTTTKEIVATILAKKYSILKNFSTENNEIGVAKTLLRLKASHQIAVLELGTNHFGEIGRLTEIVNPSVAVLLNIGKSHLQFLKNLSGVFREKSAIYRHMKPGGTIIFNADDRMLCRIADKRLPHQKISFGILKNAHVRAVKVRLKRKGAVDFWVKQNKFTIHANAKHDIYNALAAISCARFFKVPVADIQKWLKTFRPLCGRQKIYCKKGCWIIDDTYNANPLSVAAALDTLKNFPAKGRKFFIFGDMLELGKNAQAEHARISRFIQDAHVDVLMTVGVLSKHGASKLTKTSTQVFSYPDNHQASQALRAMCHSGDVLLVKGSRAMHLEEILAKVFTKK